MTSGTLGAMRKALELETTAQPALANLGSSSRAMAASSAAKMIFGRALGLGRRDGHAGDALGQRGVEAPLGGFAVGLAAGAVAGSEPGDLKPGVVLEELNEALADHSGRAEDADWVFVLHGSEHSSVQERRVQPINLQ